MTVTTVFASTNDGRIESSALLYSNATNGADLIADTGGDPAALGQLFAGGTLYVCYLGYMFWDTSAIDDADTVSAAVFSLWGATDNSTTDFTMNLRTYDWGGTLTTADWQAPSSFSGFTLLGTFATAGYSTGAYNDFTSQAGFPAAINKAGNTNAILSSSRFEAESVPLGNEYISWTTANSSGTTSDPKLVVTHAAGGGGSSIVPIVQRQYRRRKAA